MNDQRIIEANLADLHDHPVLDGFPMLTGEQFNALVDSIREHGILKPIVAVKVGEKLYTIDGRNRARAALKAGLKKASVMIAPDKTNPLDYAIESAIVGRNLTKSGVVLMLFLKHPGLAEEQNKGGRPSNRPLNGQFKKGQENRSLNERFTDSYTKVADKYHVPLQYFSLLLKVRQRCRPWPKDSDHEWKRIQRWILEDEVSITRLLPALEGWQTSHPIGKAGGDPEAAPGKAPVNLAAGFQRTFVYLRNQFSNWGNLEQETRNDLAKLWWQVVECLPEDLQAYEDAGKGEK